MHQENQKFEEMADNAEQTLNQVEGRIDAVMKNLPVEQMEKEKMELVKKAASEFISFALESGNHSLSWSENSMKGKFSSFLLEFPPGLGESFVKEVVKNNEWKPSPKVITYADTALFTFLSTLGERYLSQKKAHKKESGDSEPIDPLSIHLEGEYFPIPPGHLGTFLPEHISLVFEGDVGSWVGFRMNGGEIKIHGNTGSSLGEFMKEGTIDIMGNTEDHAGASMVGGVINIYGNAGKFAGNKMQGGRIEIFGKAGEWAGDGMKGGTLSIHGEVPSFASSAFYGDRNKGTIIWKGVTIWLGGDWTKEGKGMYERGEIVSEI